jgi:hypothetical protein
MVLIVQRFGNFGWRDCSSSDERFVTLTGTFAADLHSINIRIISHGAVRTNSAVYTNGAVHTNGAVYTNGAVHTNDAVCTNPLRASAPGMPYSNHRLCHAIIKLI